LLNKKTRLIHNFAKWLTRSLKKLNDAWNNNDASALAALFTKDAVLVNDTGPIYGRDAIEKTYADLFQKCISATTLAWTKPILEKNCG
jgi:uncharacterized protein (TIGR02246 family)